MKVEFNKYIFILVKIKLLSNNWKAMLSKQLKTYWEMSSFKSSHSLQVQWERIVIINNNYWLQLVWTVTSAGRFLHSQLHKLSSFSRLIRLRPSCWSPLVPPPLILSILSHLYTLQAGSSFISPPLLLLFCFLLLPFPALPLTFNLPHHLPLLSLSLI